MWTVVFWQATLERMIRGAAIAVSAGYFAGDKVFDALKFTTWTDVGSVALGGAFTSLVLSLIGGAVGMKTGRKGPAIIAPEEVI